MEGKRWHKERKDNGEAAVAKRDEGKRDGGRR